MKTLVPILVVCLCLLAPQSSVAETEDPNPKIENVWVKIKGQWDHNDNSVILKKQILFLSVADRIGQALQPCKMTVVHFSILMVSRVSI